ncbi:SAS10 [Sanghuangporus vaninii]
MPRQRPSRSNALKSKGKKGKSIQKWNTRDDIPLDEVDQFHEQRDKILLEGEGAAQDSDYDEDEVFALKGLDESSEEESEVEEDEDEDDDEAEETGEPEPPNKSKLKESKKNREGKKLSKSAESSEEQSDEEEEEEESWGTKKSAYYSSNAAQIDSDDEEAREMEEQEARRLQAKLRAPMREEDFGYSEALQNASLVDLKPVDDFWKPEKSVPATTVGADKVSILRHLQRTNPETLALAFEWEDIARSVVKTEKKLSEMPDNKENKALGLVHLHHQTLLTYASLLTFYLHLRASEKYAARPELLRQHPILKRLLTLKQSLITFEELDFVMSDSEDASDLDSEDSFGSDESELDDDDESDRLDTWSASKKLGLEAGELEDLLAQAYSPKPPPTGKKLPKVKLRVNPSKVDEKPQEPPKKKRKGLNGTAVTKPKVTFDVEEPSLPSKGATPGESRKNGDTARSFGFGEATSLDDADLEDKKVRRKALQFHTAKIESASARRKGARTALGGDDDVPYRERNKEKEKKKLARAAKLGEGGEDLDDVEPEGVHEQQLQKRGRDETNDDAEGSGSGVESGDDEDDGYYSLVKRQKKAKQAEKKAQYDATKAANRAEIPDDAQEQQQQQGGQRAASRAILSNKGLTPKRSKSVRNPRVKKRQKFEKAKKKLASQKAVYKGGIGDPAKYGGELSGISKVVKSVRL